MGKLYVVPADNLNAFNDFISGSCRRFDIPQKW